MLTALILHGFRAFLRRVGFALLFTLMLAAAAVVARAQGALPADSFPAPARGISAIVAPRWIAEDRRDAFGEAERVLASLRIRRGMTVADIGAGDGYYVAKLATRLGPEGKVLANDIEPRYLQLLRQRVSRARWTNVEVIEGLPHDPLLPAGSVDVAIMIHMYHEIENPFGMLYHLAFAMKPTGLVGVLDVDGPTDRHGTPPSLLRCEFQALGYSYVRRDILADGAYLMTFRPPAVAARATTAAQVRDRVAKANCRA
jgi:SAM-dependent methyltransferase